MTDTVSTAVPTSRQCEQDLHGFCPETRATCGCTGCHLGPCTSCGAGDLQKMYDDGDDKLCASCYRVVCKARQTGETSCDRCGASGAFRNPGHRRNEYLCPSCHSASGEPVVLTSSVAHLAQPCKGADITDDRHVWVHIRGSRFQCLCGAKKYDSALRETRRRELERELFHGSDVGRTETEPE